MGQSTLTELSQPPWVRMTVIFVAENVEPHEFLLPLTHTSPTPTPTECIYCENGCTSSGMPPTHHLGGWIRHVMEWGAWALLPVMLVNKSPLSHSCECLLGLDWLYQGQVSG